VSKVSNIGQVATLQQCTLFDMASEVTILSVEKDGEDGLFVTFSDGTTGGYVAEELLFLRPIRETVEKPKNPNLQLAPAMQT